jgi:predicted O-linked N-acetylglucosamine transferase (SPINDLY family)
MQQNMDEVTLANDLFHRVQLKIKQLREMEFLVENQKRDLEEQKIEMEGLQQRLQAEQGLRIAAEQKSSLIQIELEQMQGKLKKHTTECTDLQQKLKESQIELELRRASISPDEGKSIKIQELINNLRRDHQTTKAEMLQLKEINRTLLQSNAHALTQREQLAKQINELKKQIKELQVASMEIENEVEFPEPQRTIQLPSSSNNWIYEGYEEDEDADFTTKGDTDDEGEEASDRFLQLYESHRTLNRNPAW